MTTRPTQPGDGRDSTEWEPVEDWRDITDIHLPDDDQEQQ